MADALLAEIVRCSLEVSEACRSRIITKAGVKTPLLVPSFSSRGFPNVAETHRLLRDYLTEVSLISAYDLHHGLLQEDDIYATDILFLDSGGYEARSSLDPAEPYVDERDGQIWTTSKHQRVLTDLEPLSALVVVCFDTITPLAEQIALTQSLAEQYESFAVDFLCKPESVGMPFVDIDTLISNIERVATFDVLGVTEKELGESLLDRCRNVRRLRQALARHGYQTPIHIFGCLDPPTVLAYFLCGADIFDGLAWLRFAFVKGVPTYHATNLILNQDWAQSDQVVIAAQRAQNLMYLRQQARAMLHFGECHDLNDLVRLPAWGPQILDLVKTVELES